MDVSAFNGCKFWVEALVKLYSFLVEQNWLERAALKLSPEDNGKEILVQWQHLQGPENLLRVQIEAVKVCTTSTLGTFVKEFSMYLERGSDSSMGNSKYRLTIESTEPSLQLSYQIYVTPGSIQESKFNSSEDVVFRFVLQLSLQENEAKRLLDCFCMFLHLRYLIERKNFHILTTWSERAAQNRHVLTILSEWCQNVMTYGYLMTEDLPYKPLYFRPGSLRLAPGSKYSNLIGTMNDVSYGLVNIGSCRFVKSFSSYFPQDPCTTFTPSQGLEFIVSKSTKIPSSNFNIVLACAKYTKDEKTSSRNPLLTILAYSRTRSYLNIPASERKFVLDFIRKVQIYGQEVGLHFKETSQGAFGLNFTLELSPNSSSATEVYPEDALMILSVQNNRSIDDDFPNFQIDGTWSDNIIRWLLLRLARVSRRPTKKTTVGGQNVLQVLDGICRSFTDIVQTSSRIRFKRSCMEITQTKTPKEFEDKIKSHLRAFTSSRYNQARKMNGIATKSNMGSFEYLGQSVRFVNDSSQHGDSTSPGNSHDFGFTSVSSVLDKAAPSAKPKVSGRTSTGNTPNGKRSQGGRRKESSGGFPVAMSRSSVRAAMPRSDETPISPKHDDEKKYGIKMGENVSGGQILPNQQQYQLPHPLQQPQQQSKQQQQEKEQPEQPFQEIPMMPIDNLRDKVVRFSTALQQHSEHKQLQNKPGSMMKPMVLTPNLDAKSFPYSTESPLVSQGQRSATIEMSPFCRFPEGNQVIPSTELDIYLRNIQNNESIGGSTYSLASSNTSSQISSSPDMVSSDDSNHYGFQQSITIEEPFNQPELSPPLHVSLVPNGLHFNESQELFATFTKQKRKLVSFPIEPNSIEKKRRQEQFTFFDVGMGEQNDLQNNVQLPELSDLHDSLVEVNFDPTQFGLIIDDPNLSLEQPFSA